MPFDPRPFFPAQDAAYNLPMATFGVTAVDTIVGEDSAVGLVPYGVIIQEADGTLTAAVRGTDDSIEWVEDFDAIPVQTPLGIVARGIQVSFSAFRTTSGADLASYKVSRVEGHSRGGPLALLLSAKYGWPCLLYACPKLVSQQVLDKANILAGWHVNGDPVPDVAPGYPSPPNVQRIYPPPGIPILDLGKHHAFATYKAAIALALAPA